METNVATVAMKVSYCHIVHRILSTHTVQDVYKVSLLPVEFKATQLFTALCENNINEYVTFFYNAEDKVAEATKKIAKGIAPTYSKNP